MEGEIDQQLEPRRRGWWAALIAVIVTLCVIFLASWAGAGTAALFEGASGAGEAGPRRPGELDALPAWRLGAYFAGFQVAAAVLTLLAARAFYRAPADALGLTWPRGGLTAIALSAIGLLAFAAAAGGLMYHFDRQTLLNDLAPFAGMARSQAWWILLLAAGVGAPLAEELLFRGYLYRGLRTSPLGFPGAALITTALWTGLHTDYSLSGLALLFCIGFYFAWVRERSGSLLPVVTGHALYNSLIVVALALAPEGALAA